MVIQRKEVHGYFILVQIRRLVNWTFHRDLLLVICQLCRLNLGWLAHRLKNCPSLIFSDKVRVEQAQSLKRDALQQASTVMSASPADLDGAS